MISLFKSRLLFRNTKEKLYTTYLRPSLHVDMVDGFLIKTLLVNQIDQKTQRVCPRQRCLDLIKKDLEELKPD